MIPPGRCCFGLVLRMKAAAALRLCNQPWKPDLFIALHLLSPPYISTAVFYWLARPFHRPTCSCTCERAHAAAVCFPLAAALAKTAPPYPCCIRLFSVCLFLFPCTLLPFIHLSFFSCLSSESLLHALMVAASCCFVFFGLKPASCSQIQEGE